MKKKVKVKQSDRARLTYVLRFPDPNRNTSYPDSGRMYIVLINGKEFTALHPKKGDTLAIEVRCGDVITVKKVYNKNPKPDSVMTFTARENIAYLKNQSGYIKKFSVNFPDANILDVVDANDFKYLKEIK